MTVIEHLESAQTELLSKAAEIGQMIESLRETQVAGPRLVRQVTSRARPAGAKGKVSMARAALEALREAGRPLGVQEILDRAMAKGAVTESPDPLNAVDLLLYKQKSKKSDPAPIRKVEGQARTWLWDAGRQG